MKIGLEIALDRCRRLSEGGIQLPLRVHEITPIEVMKTEIIAAVAEL